MSNWLPLVITICLCLNRIRRQSFLLAQVFRNTNRAMKIVLPSALVLLLYTGASPSATGELLFHDNFTLPQPAASSSVHDPNEDLTRQQGSSAPVQYFAENLTSTSHSNGGIEANCPDFDPKSDVLLLRNMTETEGLSMWVFDLDHDFGSELKGRKWGVRYDARLTTNMTDSADNWLAIGYGGKDGTVDAGGSGSDILSFGIRTNGEALVWYRDETGAQQFTHLGVPGFEQQGQYHAEIEVDDLGDRRSVAIHVTPRGGERHTLVEDLQLDRSLEGGHFEFRAVAVSGGTPRQVLDGRIDNLEIVTEP